LTSPRLLTHRKFPDNNRRRLQRQDRGDPRGFVPRQHGGDRRAAGPHELHRKLPCVPPPDPGLVELVVFFLLVVVVFALVELFEFVVVFVEFVFFFFGVVVELV
jgi:hypothetical protein